MMVNGEETSARGMEFKYGPTEPNIKVNGSTTKPKVKESLHTSMVTFMTEIGKKIRHPAQAPIFITTVPDTKVSG